MLHACKEQNMAKKIFGTDGIRGKANHEPMTVETVLALGRAAGKVFRKRKGKHRVVIGKDTRLSCYMFENALIAGLCSMGVDTLMVGPFPTPGVAFITRAYRADAGIVISASHNAFYDNGIKFFSSEGYKLNDSWESELESLVDAGDFADSLPGDRELGRNRKIDDADGRYIEFAKSTFPKGKTLHNLKIVLDCANGACYKVAPMIFRELDAEVYTYGNTPNGLNINEDCGSLHLETTQKAVIERHADVGIAFDGDGDRVIMIDEHAQVVDGDVILAICAADRMTRGSLTNNRVVGTVMTNLGVIKALEERGIEFIASRVGDRYVIEEMLASEACLGGEQSGHLIYLDHNTTGDGLVSALQVLRIMIETETRLSDLAGRFPKYPQTMRNIAVSSKPPLETMKGLQKAIADAEKTLGSQGRVLARYSGTENILRVMVEGPTIRVCQDLAKKITQAAENEMGKK